MLRSLKNLERYKVTATDGHIGSVANFLLDDELWTVRYLVVETGGLLVGRRVLISPISFREVDWPGEHFCLKLTVDKVRHSPSVDVDEPVSRQHEREHYGYYGYPYDWDYSGLGGIGIYAGSLGDAKRQIEPEEPTEKSGDVHLRSVNEVRGYHIQGSDKAIGHVEDFLIDDETWIIRYLVIDTSNWWVGKKVLIAPEWANSISWEQRKIYVGVTRQTIMHSPEWHAKAPINREYEGQLYDYHGRTAYWHSGDRTLGAQPPHLSAGPRG